MQPLEEILRPIGATVFRALNTVLDRTLSRWSKRAFPGIGIIQDGRKYFDYHHSAADTLDKVDPQELRENVAAMARHGIRDGGHARAFAEQPKVGVKKRVS